MNYLEPLVRMQIGNTFAETLVDDISAGMFTVETLMAQIKTWHEHGFTLNREGAFAGKHHHKNYNSAIKAFRTQTHKSLLKRLATQKTAGPCEWSGM